MLRDSPHKGAGTLADALKRAEGAREFDPNGHRREFVELVKKAARLKEKARTE